MCEYHGMKSLNYLYNYLNITKKKLTNNKKNFRLNPLIFSIIAIFNVAMAENSSNDIQVGIEKEKIHKNLLILDKQNNHQNQFSNQQNLDEQFAIKPMITINNFDQPIAKLSGNQTIIGYDEKIDNQPSKAVKNFQLDPSSEEIEKTKQISKKTAINDPNDLDVQDVINPNDYLPDYQEKHGEPEQQPETVDVLQPSRKKSIVKNLYKRVFHKDAIGLPRIEVTIINGDEKQQPFNNIKSALEEVTVESIEDFTATIPRLRQIARDAAAAVGYYETELTFKQLSKEHIQVTINKVGNPVKVVSRIVDIRGDGGEGEQALAKYQSIEKDLPPKVGDIFNHGVYQQSKATVEGTAKMYGFFDGRWLNSSADIILPDNTAEVDLIYDTEKRYQFGNIEIYGIDKEGSLTNDPEKLPIKPKLLEQLMTYKTGDMYYQPLITKLNNNLLATRYFNTVDVDVILPIDTQNSQGTLAFDLQKNMNNNSDFLEDNQQDIDKNLTDNSVTQNPEDIAPIEFDVDDNTKERLQAVKQKAQRLLHAPEDIQLAPDDENKSRNPLVILANAVSKVAKKIDKKDADATLLVNASPSELIVKQSAEQVYKEKSVPTYIVLNANKKKEAQIGLGYETEQGFRVVGKLQNNLVNRHGHQAGINVEVSKSNQLVELTGSSPYKHPLNDKLSGSLSYEHKNVDDVNSTFESETIRIGLARHIKRDNDWSRTFSLRYRYDELSRDAVFSDPLLLPPPFNKYSSNFSQEALLFGYALNRITVDNRINPTTGYSQYYSLEVGSNNLLTDTNMMILRAGTAGIYSFGQDNKHQLLGKLDLGYIYSDNFNKVPYKLRFFAGGDQSIRGYATDSQGPHFQKDGFLIGGDALAVGSLEYNYEFYPQFRGAIFTDFGNAYDLNGEKNSIKVGICAGIRWASPIGIVRLDVATGISDDDKPVKLYFFIGSPL